MKEFLDTQGLEILWQKVKDRDSLRKQENEYDNDFVPFNGQQCFVDTDSGLMLKIGDGITSWINLSYRKEVDLNYKDSLKIGDTNSTNGYRQIAAGTDNSVGAYGIFYTNYDKIDDNRFSIYTVDGLGNPHKYEDISIGYKISMKAGYTGSLIGKVITYSEAETDPGWMIIEIDKPGNILSTPSWHPEDHYWNSEEPGFIWLPEKPNAGYYQFGNNSMAFGENNQVNYKDGFATGRRNIVDGIGGFTSGSDNIVAFCSNAGGMNNTVTGFYASAFGGDGDDGATGHKVTNYYGFAEGYKNTNEGFAAHAGGSNNTVAGSGAVVFGDHNECAHNTSDVGGYHNKSSASCQTVRGRYNKDDSSSLFIVGNGTANNRSNAMAVKSNGSIEAGKDTVDSDSDKTLTTKGFVNKATLKQEQRINKQEKEISNIKSILKGEVYRIFNNSSSSGAFGSASDVDYVAITKVGGNVKKVNEIFDSNFSNLSQNWITTDLSNVRVEDNILLGDTTRLEGDIAGFEITSKNTTSIREGHKYYFKVKYTASFSAPMPTLGIKSNDGTRILWLNGPQIDNLWTSDADYTGNFFYFNNDLDSESVPVGTIYHVSVNPPLVVDLTNYFGSGNEPSYEECEEIFSNLYYDKIEYYKCSRITSSGYDDPHMPPGDSLDIPQDVLSLSDYGKGFNSTIYSEEVPDIEDEETGYKFNIEGYNYRGFNELDLENKKFIINVREIDLGNLSWSSRSIPGYLAYIGGEGPGWSELDLNMSYSNPDYGSKGAYSYCDGFCSNHKVVTDKWLYQRDASDTTFIQDGEIAITQYINAAGAFENRLILRDDFVANANELKNKLKGVKLLYIRKYPTIMEVSSVQDNLIYAPFDYSIDAKDKNNKTIPVYLEDAEMKKLGD